MVDSDDMIQKKDFFVLEASEIVEYSFVDVSVL